MGGAGAAGRRRAVVLGLGALPASLALSSLCTLFAAAVLVAGGASVRSRTDAEVLFTAFCWACVVRVRAPHPEQH